MAETPLYRRLGAQPESPATEGRRPVLSSLVAHGHLARTGQMGQFGISLTLQMTR